MKQVHGASTLTLASDPVTLDVALTGGMSTAEFRNAGGLFAPYSLSPWQPGDVPPELPGLLRVLRGEFFCLPFGPQKEGPPHGAGANLDWTVAHHDESRLELRLDAGDTGASIRKTYTLRRGQPAIYYDYRISGLDGDWNFGTHPVLDASRLADGAARVSVSPFRWASVYPGWFSDPVAGERQALQPGAVFEDLREVPLAAGGSTDLTRWPSRPGHDDLVMMVNEPASASQPFAWSAVVMDGHAWICLKNPADFPATLFWMSNGGRDGEPWHGRHLGRIGIEEVCSHFCDGVDVSRENRLAGLGIPTTRRFRSSETTRLGIVHLAASVPAGFGRVVEVAPAGRDQVRITDEHGAEIRAAADWTFPLSPTHTPA